jgi:type I restriction enzyme S subunit
MAEVGLDVPQGYKRTEVGVIPEDWEVEQLQQLCRSPITYGIVQCGAHVQDGVPYIRVSDMNSDKLNIDEMLRTDPKIAASFARSKVEEGDIVYALRGKLGEVRIVDSVVAGANLTQGTARISPNKGIYNNYLLWTMRSPQSVRQALKEAKGSTFVEITLADLKRIEIPVPDRTEQTAIATALSDVDALINELEQLVAKKQAIKTATMQQLLTGRTRLPQFALREDGTPKGYKASELGEIPEDWEVVKLGDIGQTIIGLTYSPNDVASFGTLVLRSSNVQCALIDKSIEGSAFGAFMSVFRTHSSNFVFYQFQSDLIQIQINERMGATINQITNTDMSEFMISQPFDGKEQAAIASILSDMDSDISNLQQRLSKARQIKQGMMQQLLTGRIRLI